MAADTKFLGTYLNDHFAGSTAALRLARRAAHENRGNDYGRFLDRLAEEIDEDRETLRSIMRAFDVGEDPLKSLPSLVLEVVARVKLNAPLWGYSPLSRLEELEGLELGVTGKDALWGALILLEDGRLTGFDLPALEQRAKRQADEIEQHRLAAAREALADGDG
jgi:hypothetical protein